MDLKTKKLRISKTYKDSLVSHQDLIASTAQLILQRPDLLNRYFEQVVESQQAVITLRLSDQTLGKIEELKQLIKSLKGQTSNREAMEAIACQIHSIYREL